MIRFFLLTIATSSMLYGVWLVIRIFITDTFLIPSESMLPTLHPGNRIFVNKTLMGARIYKDFQFSKEGVNLKCFRTKGYRSIKHNDIVVFNMPNKEWQIKFVINYVFCKRCIALPGDSISITNGVYHNNNYQGILGYREQQLALKSIPDSFIAPGALRAIPFDDHLPMWTIKDFGPYYIPRKGDLIKITPQNAALYKILLEYETQKNVDINWEQKHVYQDGKPFTTHRFRHDYYFMAGDNVLDSNDSRYWGLVPDEYIIGIVSKTIL